MSERVKRGLGLVVIGLLGALMLLANRQHEADGEGGVAVLAILGAVGAWVGIYGLVLIALGLLRD